MTAVFLTGGGGGAFCLTLLGAGSRPIDLLKITEILYYYRLIQFILGINFKTELCPNLIDGLKKEDKD